MSQFSNIEQERTEKLEEVRRQEEEAATERRARDLGFNYINLAAVPVERDSLHFIPQTEAERTRTVVIQKKANTLRLGAVDPANQESKLAVEQLHHQGFKVEVFMISPSSFKKALGEFKFLPPQQKGSATSGEVALGQIESLKKELTTFAALKDKISKIDQGNPLTGLGASISSLLEIFLSAALNLEASDIHVEPQASGVQIRFRLDGVLQEAGAVNQTTYQSLLSRVKLLSGLQLNVQNIPQDGRFSIKQGGVRGEKGEMGIEVEVRTSVLPGAYGEYIVLRILNPNAIKLELKDLGLRETLWQKLEPELKKPNGIILVTGPTGSGKTTTLYAFLKHLNKPGVKIVTLEDPIEYHLTGINQSQIEPEKGYTFAAGLRSVLRQDPNIILVGEIRDEETADVALHAALTGHLVFSTLHTNDAVGAVPRFLDLNAKPQILASALNAAIGQRLVRKLCQSCKKIRADSSTQLERIEKELNPALEKDKFHLAKPIFLKGGENPNIYEAAGCEKCGGTGYKGRIGVYEILFVDENMEKLVGRSPSHQEVLAEAKKSGFATMYQDGLMRVLEGLTTLEEVERVTGSA